MSYLRASISPLWMSNRIFSSIRISEFSIIYACIFTCIFLPLELVLFHDSMLIVSWLLTFLLRLRLFFNASASTSSAIKPVRRLKYRLELSDNLSNFRESIVVVRYNMSHVCTSCHFWQHLSIDDLKLSQVRFSM